MISNEITTIRVCCNCKTLKLEFIDFVTANCQILVLMSTNFSFCCVFIRLFELMLKQLHIISSRPYINCWLTEKLTSITNKLLTRNH